MAGKEQKISINYNKAIKALVFLIVLYSGFGLYKALYENYTINQKLKNLEADVRILQEKNREIENLNAYYKTNSYKEKEARARLSLAKPGETLLIVTGQKEEEIRQLEEEKKIPKTNPELWYDYFFKKG